MCGIFVRRVIINRIDMFSLWLIIQKDQVTNIIIFDKRNENIIWKY